MRCPSVGALLLGLVASVPAARATPEATAIDGDAGPLNAIVFEPLAVVFARAFAVEYERRVAPHWSWFVQPSVVFGASRLSTAGVGGDETARGFSGLGFGLTSGVRFFPLHPGLDGFFISAFVSGAWTTTTGAADTGTIGDAWGWGGGAMVGWTFLPSQVFDLSLGLGLALTDRHDAEHPDGHFGVLPAIRVAVGAAF